MNHQLNEDWEQGKGLFAHKILTCLTDYSNDIQLNILNLIWEYLNSNIEIDKLLFLEDWHNHDGYISKEVIINKQEFRDMLSCPNRVFRNRDEYVYDLVYNNYFMLRWYSKKEELEYNDFTLILSNGKLSDIKELISNKGIDSNKLIIENAKQYFDKLYSG